MKSICIKTNNSKLLDYLEDEISQIDLDNVYFSCNEFKHYKNIVIHYKGNNTDDFYKQISNILCYLVINILEYSIIKKIILSNYFYFDNLEVCKILNICEESLYEHDIFNEKYSLLYDSFYKYICNNRNLVLNGFINFRIKNYFEYLNSMVDTSVNSFIVEREYLEFISLLKMYISTQTSTCEIVHLIYSENNSVLLDNNKQVIEIDDNIFNTKYLSDITFSSHDYALNTLLTLLPKKIFIHLIDSTLDEFINTLQLVFENRIEFCTECDICNLYKMKNKSFFENKNY